MGQKSGWIQNSTVTALHTLNNTVAKGFNQIAPPARTITVVLNVSKPFDTINIHTLIRMLLQTNSIVLLPLVARCLDTIDVCIWHMIVFMSVVVIVWGLWECLLCIGHC